MKKANMPGQEESTFSPFPNNGLRPMIFIGPPLPNENLDEDKEFCGGKDWRYAFWDNDICWKFIKDRFGFISLYSMDDRTACRRLVRSVERNFGSKLNGPIWGKSPMEDFDPDRIIWLRTIYCIIYRRTRDRHSYMVRFYRLGITSREPKKEQMSFPKAWAKCKGMGGYIPCPRDNWANNQLNEFIREYYTTIVSTFLIHFDPQFLIHLNQFWSTLCPPTLFFRTRRRARKTLMKQNWNQSKWFGLE